MDKQYSSNNNPPLLSTHYCADHNDDPIDCDERYNTEQVYLFFHSTQQKYTPDCPMLSSFISEDAVRVASVRKRGTTETG